MVDSVSEDGKITYEPSQEKRFHISPDQYSRERIKHVKEAYDGLNEKLPGISIGLTLFGSLAKGKNLTAETAYYLWVLPS